MHSEDVLATGQDERNGSEREISISDVYSINKRGSSQQAVRGIDQFPIHLEIH